MIGAIKALTVSCSESKQIGSVDLQSSICKSPVQLKLPTAPRKTQNYERDDLCAGKLQPWHLLSQFVHAHPAHACWIKTLLVTVQIYIYIYN